MKKITLIALLALTGKGLMAQTALTVQDTRSTPTTPGSYSRSVESHFKATTVLGLSIGAYQTVLGIRGWSDDTGGRTHELSFGDDNNISVRSGYSSTGWEGWRSLLISNENGNFSIGQSSIPTEKLTINGNILLANRTNSYLISYASLSETNSGASTILGNNVVSGTATNTVKKTRSIADAGSFVSLNYFHGITFHTGVNGDLNLDHPVEESEKMRIAQNGNVGIGTTTPSEKLSVNGKIRAKEVKVEATNWPDYVFEDSYKIETLQGLESYIKTNKHLPDMPSAKEVETNGVAVSEMLKLQQKKIEELTLHLINLSKKVESQDTLIKKLKKKVK